MIRKQHRALLKKKHKALLIATLLTSTMFLSNDTMQTSYADFSNDTNIQSNKEKDQDQVLPNNPVYQKNSPVNDNKIDYKSYMDNMSSTIERNKNFRLDDLNIKSDNGHKGTPNKVDKEKDKIDKQQTDQKKLENGQNNLKTTNYDKSKPLICLDPGHGGDDSGAISVPVNGKQYTEADLAMKVGNKVKGRLESLNYGVYFVRKDSNGHGFKYSSSDYKNRQQRCKDNGGDIFISIHFNSAEAGSAHGWEILHNGTGKGNVSKLYEAIGDELRKNKDKHHVEQRPTPYPVRPEIAVVSSKGPVQPTILVECGFVSNLKEVQNFLTDETVDGVAQSIADGTDRFVKDGYKK